MAIYFETKTPNKLRNAFKKAIDAGITPMDATTSIDASEEKASAPTPDTTVASEDSENAE